MSPPFLAFWTLGCVPCLYLTLLTSQLIVLPQAQVHSSFLFLFAVNAETLTANFHFHFLFLFFGWNRQIEGWLIATPNELSFGFLISPPAPSGQVRIPYPISPNGVRNRYFWGKLTRPVSFVLSSPLSTHVRAKTAKSNRKTKRAGSSKSVFGVGTR